MASVTLETIVVQTKPILSAKAGNEILAMDEQSGMCFSFSGSGRFIWEYAKEPIRVRDICARLREHYRVDEPTCVSETLVYIDTLIAENLLRVDPTEARN
jgi:Coenzyme PQQ synthesis protein D (PqqD)